MCLRATKTTKKKTKTKTKIKQRHSETQVTTSQQQLDAHVQFLIFDDGMCNRGQHFLEQANNMGDYMRTISNVSCLE